MWIVRLALQRPYTFIVMALVIILLTPVVLLRTPTDIFPEINIPVISLVWTFTGLEPQEMEQRITGNVERGIATLVNDVEHTESQSLNGIAVIKVYFQPQRQHSDGARPNRCHLANFLALPAARNYSAAGHHLLRVHCSGHSDRLDQRHPQRTAALRHWQQFYSHPACDHSGRRHSLPLRRQAAPGFLDTDTTALQSKGLSAVDIVNAVNAQT